MQYLEIPQNRTCICARFHPTNCCVDVQKPNATSDITALFVWCDNSLIHTKSFTPSVKTFVQYFKIFLNWFSGFLSGNISEVLLKWSLGRCDLFKIFFYSVSPHQFSTLYVVSFVVITLGFIMFNAVPTYTALPRSNSSEEEPADGVVESSSDQLRLSLNWDSSLRLTLWLKHKLSHIYQKMFLVHILLITSLNDVTSFF